MTIAQTFAPNTRTTREQVAIGGTGHCDADHCELWWDGKCALSSGYAPVALAADAVDRSAGCECYEPWQPGAA